MKIIYGNIIWFAVVIYGLIDAAIQRHNSTEWNSMTDILYKYDIMYGSLAICLVATILGLLMKRKWGYVFAVSANATLAASSLGILSVSLIFALPALSVLEIMKINLSNMLVGIVSLGFFIWLMKSKKEYQNKCRL